MANMDLMLNEIHERVFYSSHYYYHQFHKTDVVVSNF